MSNKYKTGKYICSCSTGIIVKGIFRKMNKVFLVTEEELKRDDVKKNIDLGHIKYVGQEEKQVAPEKMESEPIEVAEPVSDEESVSEENEVSEVDSSEELTEEAEEESRKVSKKEKKKK